MSDAPATAPIPANARARQLRACLLCSLIQSPADFRRNGCPNCEEIMQMKQSQDRVAACTTTHFEGVVAVVDSESWVARWQRTCECLPPPCFFDRCGEAVREWLMHGLFFHLLQRSTSVECTLCG